MTQLLEKAYSRVIELPDPEQDAIASLILERLEGKTNGHPADAETPDATSRTAETILEYLKPVKMINPPPAGKNGWSEVEGYE